MAQRQIQQATRLRESYRVRVQNIHQETRAPQFNEWTAAFGKAKLARLNDVWQKFEEQHEVILQNAAENQVAELGIFIAAAEGQYIEAVVSIEQHIQALEIAQRPNHHPAHAAGMGGLLAAGIGAKMPEFRGDRTEWVSWRDQFTAKVLQKEATNVEKLEVLLASVTGDAKTSMGTWPLEEANFQPAWDKLKRVYDDDYGLIRAHVDKILSIQQCNGSAQSIRHLIDVTDQELRSLNKYDINVNHWDTIILCIMINKLDPETNGDWEMKRNRENIPTRAMLVDYLERRVLAVRGMENNASHSRGSVQPSTSKGGSYKPYSTHRNQAADQRWAARPKVVTQTKANCLHCEGPHWIQQCTDFRFDKTLAFREGKFKTWKLCRACCRDDHKTEDCRRNNCPKCVTEKHNSLLCPRANNQRQLRSLVVKVDQSDQNARKENVAKKGAASGGHKSNQASQ